MQVHYVDPEVVGSDLSMSARIEDNKDCHTAVEFYGLLVCRFLSMYCEEFTLLYFIFLFLLENERLGKNGILLE